jgi:hypothetical protein
MLCSEVVTKFSQSMIHSFVKTSLYENWFRPLVGLELKSKDFYIFFTNFVSFFTCSSCSGVSNEATAGRQFPQLDERVLSRWQHVLFQRTKTKLENKTERKKKRYFDWSFFPWFGLSVGRWLIFVILPILWQFDPIFFFVSSAVHFLLELKEWK